MSYLNEIVNEHNYQNILDDIEDNKEDEKQIAFYILNRLIEESSSLFKNYKELSNINLSLKDSSLLSFSTEDGIILNPNVFEDFSFHLSSFLIILNSFVFFDKKEIPEDILITRKNLLKIKNEYRKPLHYIVEISVEPELKDSYAEDIRSWNQQNVHSDDLSSVIFSLNTIINYKQSKIFSLNLVDSLSDKELEHFIVFEKKNDRIQLINTKEEDKHIKASQYVNTLLKKEGLPYFYKVLPDDLKYSLVDMGNIHKLQLLSLPAVCQMALTPILEGAIIKKSANLLKLEFNNEHPVYKARNRI